MTKPYTHVGMTHNEGLEYGLDGVTVVSWKFYTSSRPKIRYCYALPQDVIDNLKFQRWAEACENAGLLFLSFNQLRVKLLEFRA